MTIRSDARSVDSRCSPSSRATPASRSRSVVRNVVAKIGERDRGAAPHQQLRRRDAAAGGPDDGHALAAHGEALGRQSSELQAS